MPFLGSAHGAVSYGRARRGASWVNGGVVTTLATGFNFPEGVAVLSDGNIVVVDTNNQRIQLVTPLGSATTLATGFYYPVGVAVISSSVIAIGDQNNSRIRLVAYPSGTGTTLASGLDVQGVALLPDGNIIVAGYSSHTIKLVTNPGGVVTTLAGSGSPAFADGTGTNASFNYPSAVAYDPTTGKIVVGDCNNHCIRYVTYPGGVVTTLAGSGGGYADGTGTNASFNQPRGIAMTPTGVIVVADYGNNRIRLVTSAGLVTTLAGSGSGSANGTGTSATFNSPYAVAVNSSSGVVVVCDSGNNTIRLIT